SIIVALADHELVTHRSIDVRRTVRRTSSPSCVSTLGSPVNYLSTAEKRAVDFLPKRHAEGHCNDCYGPENPNRMKRLVLLQTPAHAASEIKRFMKVVRDNDMPVMCEPERIARTIRCLSGRVAASQTVGTSGKIGDRLADATASACRRPD